jgi:type IV secretion system protein VirB4
MRLTALPLLPLLEPREVGKLEDLLDWLIPVGLDPTVIRTKTGRLMTSLSYRGPDLQYLPHDERLHYLGRLHAVLATLGEGWCADFEWRHTSAPVYPAAQWPTPVHWLIDEIRRLEYEQVPRYESTTHLTLTWTRPRGNRRWLDHCFVSSATREFQLTRDALIRQFQQAVQRFTAMLQDILPEITPLTLDETCSYLHRQVSWDSHAIRCPSAPDNLARQLTNVELTPGAPLRLGSQLVQPLRIANWQESLSTWLPTALEKLPFPCAYRVRWVPMGLRAARTWFRWHEQSHAIQYRSLRSQGRHALGARQGTLVAGSDENPDALYAGRTTIQARDEVLTGQEVLGSLTATLLTWAPDTHNLDAQVQALETVAFTAGLILDREETGATLAWLSSLAGHVGLGIRGESLRTQELTALMPHGAVWGGPPDDAYLQAAPVLVAMTDAAPFRLVTHVGNLGHMMVAGPSQTGKSTALGLLTQQWFRYPQARVCAFDLDYALKCATVLGGGVHYDLGHTNGLAFQPLRCLETDDDLRWAAIWMDTTLRGQGLPPTPDERAELLPTLHKVAALPASLRTLSTFQRLLPVQRLKVGLAPFLKGGASPFFDASADALSLETSRYVCFEMSGLLTAPAAIAPALAYIVRQLERHWFDGSPVLLVFDEAKWLLGLEGFIGNLQFFLKARAKKNVSVVLCTQELADMAETPAWHAIQGNVPTQLLLPNSAASRPGVREFYASIRCAEDDIDRLATLQAKRDYLYRSPLGTQVFQLALDPVQRALCAANSLEELALLATLQAQHPPSELPVAWCRALGFEDAALVLDDAQQRGKDVA